MIVSWTNARPVQIHHFSDSNLIRFTHNFYNFNSYWILSTATHKSIKFFRFNSDNNKSRFNCGFNLSQTDSTRQIQPDRFNPIHSSLN